MAEAQSLRGLPDGLMKSRGIKNEEEGFARDRLVLLENGRVIPVPDTDERRDRNRLWLIPIPADDTIPTPPHPGRDGRT